jgi:hypothetical protein
MLLSSTSAALSGSNWQVFLKVLKLSYPLLIILTTDKFIVSFVLFYNNGTATYLILRDALAGKKTGPQLNFLPSPE